MLLHNQTRNTLNWEASGRVYTWEPFGSLDVPDWLVPHLKVQRVPVGEVQVSPRQKAQAVVDEEQAAFRSDELRALKRKAEEADDALATARQAVEAAELRRGQAEERARALADRLTELNGELDRSKADTKAAEALLQEQARDHAAALEKAQLAAAGAGGKKKGEGSKSAQG